MLTRLLRAIRPRRIELKPEWIVDRGQITEVARWVAVRHGDARGYARACPRAMHVMEFIIHILTLPQERPELLDECQRANELIVEVIKQHPDCSIYVHLGH